MFNEFVEYEDGIIHAVLEEDMVGVGICPKGPQEAHKWAYLTIEQAELLAYMLTGAIIDAKFMRGRLK